MNPQGQYLKDSSPLANKKYFITIPFSCVSSRINAHRYEDYIRNLGAKKVEDAQEADIVLVVTCAFSNEFERESLKNVCQQIPRLKTNAKLIVSGCLPAMAPSKLAEIKQALVFSPKSEKELPVLLGLNVDKFPLTSKIQDMGRYLGQLDFHQSPVKIQILFKVLALLFNMDEVINFRKIPLIGRKLSKALSAGQTANLRAFAINVSQGCLGNCSFCVIPKSKGSTQSVPLGQIVEVIREKINLGVRNIVLTSEDTGAYGKDLGINLMNLLDEVHKIPSKFSLHLNFFDPRWLRVYGDELISILKFGKISFLQIPMQSGSDRVLRLMRRAYSATEVLPYLQKMRKRYPQICLQTQMIAGFPSETEADFNQSLELIKAKIFDQTWVFGFSSRPGAETEKMSGHLEYDLIMKRTKKLRIAAGDYLNILSHNSF